MPCEPIGIAPDDEHNRKLIANVHPPDWENPVPEGRYNLVVIGGGTAGLVTAVGAAGLGAKVALIERHLMGGDCLNVGCVPSKALISAARVAATVRDADEFGVRVPEGTRVDFAAVMERMRRLRAEISPHDSAARLQGLGIDVYLGSGRFESGETISVAGQTLRFRKAVIATGGRAMKPDVPGLAEAGFLTNETVFELTELPRRLAIIGGGPIGCELAQAFARFGSEVTVIDIAPQILGREDADAAGLIAEVLRSEGVQMRLDSRLAGVEVVDDGKAIRFEGDSEAAPLVVDEILIGAGRVPNVEGLNLAAAGIEADEQKGVTVNDRLQTSNPRVFAAGDIASPYRFTHAADFFARLVIRNALFLGRSKASDLTIPWCTYTSPEIAHIGLYPRDAEERGIAIDTYVQELADVDRAVLEGTTKGFVKIHVKAGNDKILGATIVAENAGDMISEIAVAMASGAGLGKIADVIHPYPTQAEAIRKLGDQYNRTRLTGLVKTLFAKWLSWTR